MMSDLRRKARREWRDFMADDSGQLRGILGQGGAVDLSDIGRLRARTLGSNERQAEPEGSGDGEFHTFNVTGEFDTVGLTDLTHDRWVTVWELTVDPQVAYVWGYGSPNTRQVGRIFGDLTDQAAQAAISPAKIRFSSDNARQSDPDRHGVFDADEIRQTIQGREDWVRYHERDMPMVQQDSRLQVQVKSLEGAGAESDIDNGDSELIANATEFEQPA